MTPPSILISDYTSTPPITTHYINTNLTLSLPTIYPTIKSLLTHPPCTHRRSPTTWPCTPCVTAFQHTYWTSAATLLDYLASFAALDTPPMHSVWFHLLDVWQESAAWLPARAVLATAAGSPSQVWGSTGAVEFTRDVQSTCALVSATLLGAKDVYAGDVVHDPEGVKPSPVDAYETGPWVSGVKPWAQFLSQGAPGVAAQREAVGSDGSSSHVRGHGSGKAMQVLPMSAIGIMQTHTLRARALAARIYASQDADSVLEDLSWFDGKSLRFPTNKDRKHTYTSTLTGRSYTYCLVNGAPPVSRKAGLGDLTMLADNPDWNLLDECVGMCRGIDPYVPLSGREGDEDNGGDEDEDADEDEDEDVFDMWIVREFDGTGTRKCSPLAGFSDMFDDWYANHMF